MSPVRRLLLVLAGAAIGALPLGALAQEARYPDKPIRMIIPWPAGGLVDILGRAVGKATGDALGQPVVVENRTGAGGSIGAEAVATAAPDGYTILLSTSALNMNAALGIRTRFDLFKDFEPIVVAAYAPSILVCNNDLPVRSVGDLVALAQREPGRHTYASAGIGSPAHFSGELLKSLAGIEMTHVAYKGAPPAMLDVIAGRVDCLFANIAVGQPQIRAGKVRPLAVTSAKRIPSLPDLPTMAEAGVPGFEADQWLGFLAPAATPQPIVATLAREIGRSLGTAEVRAALEKNGMTVAAGSTPASFRRYIQEDYRKWSSLVQKAHIRLD
jgi:tripartite-type tricarboxylate transporter receptor subunit TctC